MGSETGITWGCLFTINLGWYIPEVANGRLARCTVTHLTNYTTGTRLKANKYNKLIKFTTWVLSHLTPNYTKYLRMRRFRQVLDFGSDEVAILKAYCDAYLVVTQAASTRKFHKKKSTFDLNVIIKRRPVGRTKVWYEFATVIKQFRRLFSNLTNADCKHLLLFNFR